MRKQSIFDELLKDADMPAMYRVDNDIPAETLTDIEGAVRETIRRRNVLAPIKPGDSVAIGAGSREIANICIILKTLIGELKSIGAEPFIVPAMGSHGGATAEGQRAILHDYGITEENMGVPVKATMDTVCLGTTANKGFEVHLDKNAAAARWIIPVGRIKPHTEIKGPIQSGLMKMLTIGLGKQKGASICHACGYADMSANIEEIASAIIAHAPVLFGLGIVENARHETYCIEAVPAAEIRREEPALLEIAKHQLPSIPFKKIDLLVVEQMGKDISGAGMDPNVTGRSSFGIEAPFAERVVVLGLTDVSHGNATGIGNADTISQRLYEKIDFEMTYPNSLTCRDVAGFKIPVVMPNDHLAFRMALCTITGTDKKLGYRIAWIRDTNHLGRMYISSRLIEEAGQNPRLTIDKTPLTICYDEDDYFTGFEKTPV